DKRLEGLVKNLFRPSYGGNRNFTLMYTLGEVMVSSDDDMRPYSLIEDSPESLGVNEVSRGRLHKVGENGYTRKSFDIISAFLHAPGKPVSEIPENYERGECWWTAPWTWRPTPLRDLLGRTRSLWRRAQSAIKPSSRSPRRFAPAPMTSTR